MQSKPKTKKQEILAQLQAPPKESRKKVLAVFKMRNGRPVKKD